MRQNIKTIALFLGLSVVAVSCQKENIVEQSIYVEETQAYISVNYTIDGVAMHATFQDEASWQEFLHWMFALAEEGHRVSFGDSNRVQSLKKEVVTYTTQSQSDAETWCDKKAKEGYQVYLTFDDKTHTYTCVAIK